MKKFLSCLLAIIMVVAMLPAGVAFAAEGDITLDFGALLKGNENESLTADLIPWPERFSVNRAYDGNSTANIKAWRTAGQLNIVTNPVWVSDPTSGYNRIGFSVNIAEGEAGWYSPEVLGANVNAVAAVYCIAPDKASYTYLGDYDFNGGAAKKLNAVYLSEGTNILVFGKIGGVSGGAMAFKKVTFEKLSAQEAPTASSVETSAVPEYMLSDSEYELTASLVMSDGVKYSFADYTINTSKGTKVADTTADRLEITSSNEGIFEITDVAKGGPGKTDEYTFTVKGVSGGTADIVFTPYINNVAQTPITKEITITGVPGDITLDFVALAESVPNSSLSGTNIPWPARFKNNTAYGNNDSNWTAYWNTCAQVAVADTWDNGGSYGCFGVDVNLEAYEAGWYSPEITAYTTAAADHTISVYSVSGSTATYLGDFDLSEAAAAKKFNAVYLAAGKNTLVFCVRSNSADGHAVKLKKIIFDRLDVQAAPTVSELVTDLPATVALGEAATAEASLEMSDGVNYSFADYTINTSNGAKAAATTANRMEITSSDEDIIEVAEVAKGGAGYSDEYSFEVTAVGYGTADVVFTPYFGDVPGTPITKSVTVPYPNATVSYSPNFYVAAVVGSGDIDTTATSLITSEDITVGAINSAALGDTVKLKAESTDELKFLYWYNGNSKVILSDSAEYSFTAGTKAAIYAKYARADGTLTEYATSAGQIVAEVSGETECKEFGTYYKLFVEKAAAAAATLVEKTAASDDFVCWKKNGKIVSYNENYSFWTWADATDAVESAAEEKSDIPAVVLFENGDAYMLELVNFEGVEIVEKGILFADGGTPTVDSFGAKAVATTDKTQFTATSDDATVARAYVIYKDGASFRVAYSD